MAAFRAEWATPEYWLAFAPSLHLAPPEDCGLFDDGGGWGVDVAALGDAVVALGEAGWPPIYVLVYDEAWVLRGRLAHTLRGAADLAVNFDFAAFHVKAGGNAQTLAAGWAPHRDRDDAAHVGGAVADGFAADGAPRCATAWVALSDATPATSCLYCVPRARDPGYAAGDGGRSPLEACFAAGPASFRHLLVYARSADAGIAADRRRHWACFARSADAFDAMYARHCRAEFDLLGAGG
ncbi:hypothetical protein JL722_1265 [Aureococcus anophagefferens]|nr:hypothetical protein JL722_1265 [Aureococcus anophagefferens]